MKAEFNIKLKEKDLFRFNMYHSYHKVTTWLFTIIGIVIFALSFTTLDEIETSYTMMYWACGLIFVFYTPFNLRTSAKLRMKEGSPMTKSLHYVFSEAGISVSYAEDEEEGVNQTVAWSQLYRVIETKRQMLIYTSRINASVLPKEQIVDLDALREIFTSNIPAYRLKLKK